MSSSTSAAAHMPQPLSQKIMQSGSQAAKSSQSPVKASSGFGKFLIITGIFLSSVGTAAAAALTVGSLVGTVSAGASGVGAAAVVPGVFFTLFFGGATVGCACLTSYLFRKLRA